MGFSERNTSIIEKLTKKAIKSTYINPDLYQKYQVKRGLRDIDGKGVPAGLTEISDIISYKVNEKGEEVSCEGELYYRGINIEDLIKGSMISKVHAFEEAAYLLLFGDLPDRAQLAEFETLLTSYRELPKTFVRDIIMKAPSEDMMNAMARSVLALYYYDNNADDISISNILKQSLQLTAQFPLIAVYGLKAYEYYYKDKSLFIHHPDASLGTAANIFRLLRMDSSYTELEERMLDLLLVLHAEHGGGNNSTFAMHLLSSSATDTYSCISGALGSLKGPRHGGANIKVVKMFEDLKKNIRKGTESEVEEYLNKVLDKQAFDKQGLIYGMGHAVYSLSDPRANIIREYVEKLALEKGRFEEFDLYKKVEKLAPQIIGDRRKTYKGVSANVDFYSGFAYSMLDIPVELFTPLFAVSRIVGWSAHRIEEVSNSSKIIRPGYVSIAPHRKYTPMENR